MSPCHQTFPKRCEGCGRQLAFALVIPAQCVPCRAERIAANGKVT